MNAPTALRRAKHQRQAVGVYGDLVMHGGEVAVLPCITGGRGVVFAFTGNYRTVHGKCALLFNG